MAKVFDHASSRIAARLAGAGLIGLALGAAAPAKSPDALSLQVTDGAYLGQRVASPAPQAAMQPAMFQPAPMPDPDAAGPGGRVAEECPSLMPSLLSTKREFAGDGFSYSSSQEGAVSHKSRPAAGLNLSVPVGQNVGHSNPIGD
jgi:hypothetical protein